MEVQCMTSGAGMESITQGIREHIMRTHTHVIMQRHEDKAAPGLSFIFLQLATPENKILATHLIVIRQKYQRGL